MRILIATKNKGKAREMKEFFQTDGLEILSLSDIPNAPEVEETGKTFEENALLKAKTYFEWFPSSHLRSKDRNREIEDSRFSSSDGIGEKIGAGFGVVADDGGLEIDFLNGEPGVLSRCWSFEFASSSANASADKQDKPGMEKTDQELIDIALKKLQGVPWEKRTARLRTVVTYYDGKHILSETASIDGYITEKQEKECEPGYPFRAIFWISRFSAKGAAPASGWGSASGGDKLFQDLTHEEHEAINHRRKACLGLRKGIMALI